MAAPTVRRIVSTRLPTRWGLFQAIAFERELFEGDRSIETAVALILGDPSSGAPLVRIHSQCFTGEEEKFSPHGYAVLTLDRSTLKEEVRDASGLVIYERVLT